nr:TRAP transporter small permease [uncultured Cohaesibacter sp.]
MSKKVQNLNTGDKERKRHTRLTWETAPAWLFALVVIATTYEVIARYVFMAPTVWANELSLYVCAIGYVYAGIYSMRHDRHLRITIAYDLAGPKLRLFFDIVQFVSILIFCAALCIYGFDEAWEALTSWEKYGTAFNAPIPATIKPFIVVCGAVMAVYAARNFTLKLAAFKAAKADGGHNADA